MNRHDVPLIVENLATDVPKDACPNQAYMLQLLVLHYSVRPSAPKKLIPLRDILEAY